MYNQEYIVDEIIKQDLIKEHPELKKLIRTTSPHEVRGGIMSVLDKNRRVHRDIKFYENLTKKFEYESYIDEIVVNVRKYIEVADCEVKDFGEVMTPISLVEDMLNKLPEEVWSNKDLKWLDPCCGVGTFPSVIVQRLMKGLKTQIPNPKKRYKHIIEEMIYVCELQAKNLFAFHYVFDKPDIYELNTFYGSFLTDEFNEHMKNEWNIEKFDIVVGNPPYQENTGKDGKTASTLWPRFLQKIIETTIKIDGYLLFITPISWMSPGKQLIRNRIMPIYFMCNKFIHLDLDCGSYFNVGSYFSYYLLQIKNGYDENKKITHNTKITSNKKTFYFNFSDMDFIPIPKQIETLTITNKVFSSPNKISLKSSSLTRSDKKWVVKEKSNLHKYPIKHTNTENLWSSIKPESYGIKKVIFNSTGNFNPIYDNGKYGTTQITRWVEICNENEGFNLINYLNSKVIKFVLSNCRWSGAASKVVFEKIPVIDLTKIYTDIDLYKHFNLSQEEINLIESQTK
jgi:site-specific DNA-methyltransferase (adenine-specific)